MMYTCPECGQLFDAGFFYGSVELCTPECRAEYATGKAEYDHGDGFRNDELRLQLVKVSG